MSEIESEPRPADCRLSMRPLASTAAPPMSAIDSRSILRPVPSKSSNAWVLVASTPA